VIPRRRKAATVRVSWVEPYCDTECQVECSVSPGWPGRRPSFSCPGEPPEPPEVEILRVLGEDGKPRPDLIALVEADWDRIEERAIEEAEESHAAAYEAAMDDAADAARDERRLGW
jgi:hypothetical protein